jgi:hypothetical protein
MKNPAGWAGRLLTNSAIFIVVNKCIISIDVVSVLCHQQFFLVRHEVIAVVEAEVCVVDVSEDVEISDLSVNA